jgi:hypothetical protein
LQAAWCDRSAARPREISSRSSNRRRHAARRRGSGRMPPQRSRYARTVPVQPQFPRSRFSCLARPKPLPHPVDRLQCQPLVIAMSHNDVLESHGTCCFSTRRLGSCFSHVLIQVFFHSKPRTLSSCNREIAIPRSPCGCWSSFLTST